MLGDNPAAAGVGGQTDHHPATDIDCDDCGKPMKIRKGRRGYFLGCSGYPKCKNTGEVPAKLVDELGLSAGEKTPPPTEDKSDGDDIATDIAID